MRKPDNTIVFNTPVTPVTGGAGTSGPVSRGPASLGPNSLRGPASKEFEKQWFNRPVDLSPASMPPSSLMATRLPLGDEVLAERRGFIPRKPERGLAFVAASLALVAVAAAGTYFFFGMENTARRETPAEVGTTTVTNADVPATAQTSSPIVPSPALQTREDLNWQEPVVDAVRAPGLARPVGGAQSMPTERPSTNADVTPSHDAIRTAPTAREVPMNDAQRRADDLGRMGLYPSYNPSPGDNTMTPPPVQRTTPSAGDPEATTHMTPSTDTMTNPNGEPAMPGGGVTNHP